MDPIRVEEAVEVPEGVYYSKVVETQDFRGGYQPTARVFFRLDPKTGYEGVLNGLFPCKATPRNKTGKLLLATIGSCIPRQVYQWDVIVGKYCYVYVEIDQTEEGPVSRVRRAVYPAPRAAAVEHTPAPPVPITKERAAPQPAEASDQDIPF